jgi:hypothetical protein
MKLIRKLLGFDSPYSWMKWLRIPLAGCILIAAYAFSSNFGGFAIESAMDGDIIGLIVSILVFFLFFGPLLLAMLAVTTLIGFLIGGTKSVSKQRESYRETAATGSAELMAVEKLRTKSQLMNMLSGVSFIALSVLGLFLLEPLYETFGKAGIYGYTALAGILMLVVWLKKLAANQQYSNAFKETVVKKGLASVFDNMDFRPEEKLDRAVVKAAALFGPYDIYSGNDYLSADYHGHHFVQSDILLQEEHTETYTDEDGNTKTRTKLVAIFRGRLMVFDYDALSNEPVAVYDRGGKRPGKQETVQTELDAFNRQFSIGAPSPAAALRILTPPVLEGIVLAREKLGCPLSLSFKDDKLYVALANGNAFEAAGGDTTLSEQRKRVTGEITAILALIDTLYLKK